MTTWIALTEADLAPILSASQRETLATRPAKGATNDALTAVLAETTDDLREAIRSQPLNRLSADVSLLPPELRNDAAYLAVKALEGRIPGFLTTDTQRQLATLATATVAQIRSGVQPISVPDEPESAPSIRSAFGPDIVHKRQQRMGASRLRGL